MPDNGKGENIEVESRVYLDQEFIQKHNGSPAGGMIFGQRINGDRGTVKKIGKKGIVKVDLDGHSQTILVPIENLNLTKS